MEDPRLSWLDQRRLIEERDKYRRLFEEVQANLDTLTAEFEGFKQEHQYCMPAESYINLDDLN